MDILKEMEMVARSLQASKVAVVTTSTFSPQAMNYVSRKNIKLVDRDGSMVLAKRYAQKNKMNKDTNENQDADYGNESYDDSYYENEYLSTFSTYIGYEDYVDQYDDAYYENLAMSKSSFSFLKRSKSNSNNQRSRPIPQRQPRRSLAPSRPNLSNRANNFSYDNRGHSINWNANFSYPIVLIFLVVIISYFIVYVLGVLCRIKSGVIGLVEMVVSLVLSYGLVFFLGQDGATVLIKGSIVFFVSLVALIGIILFI